MRIAESASRETRASSPSSFAGVRALSCRDVARGCP